MCPFKAVIWFDLTQFDDFDVICEKKSCFYSEICNSYFRKGPMCTDYMFGTGKFQGMIQLMVGKYDMKFEATYDTVSLNYDFFFFFSFLIIKF